MRKYSVILFTLMAIMGVLIYLMSMEKIDQKNIYGAWQGVNSGNLIIFNFLLNDKCSVHNLNGKNESFDATCTVDLNKKPAALTISEISSGLTSLYAVIDFSDSNALRISKFSQKWRTRPIVFNRGSDIVLYKERNR